MLILYKNDRNVRFVLFTKTSTVCTSRLLASKHTRQVRIQIAAWLTITFPTSQHSSRMRTARLPTVSRGISGPVREAGGGGVVTHLLDVPIPPPQKRHGTRLWTDWQVSVKTLPSRNYCSNLLNWEFVPWRTRSTLHSSLNENNCCTCWSRCLSSPREALTFMTCNGTSLTCSYVLLSRSGNDKVRKGASKRVFLTFIACNSTSLNV